MSRERGFTLLELVVTMAVFGIFLMIIGTITVEMRGQDQRNPVDFQQHPQIIAVLSRLRKDVLDAFGADPYPASFQTYKQSPDVLIVYSVQTSGYTQTVVWDFSEPGVARRKAFSVGGVVSDWVARGVPHFSIEGYEIPDRPWGVRVRAFNKKGQLAVDEILQPRAHE